MKGVKSIYLHPDNLKGGFKYRITIRGQVNREVQIVQEGKFVKLCVNWESDNCKLAALFLFHDSKLPQAITWDRFVHIEELKHKGEEDNAT